MLEPETAAPLPKVKWMGLKPHKQRQQHYLKNSHFLHSVNVNKSLRIYHLQHKKHKKSTWVRSEFHLKKLAKSYTNRNKTNISENTHFCIVHTLINNLRMVHLPHRNYKNLIGSSLNFTSKNWLSPIINKCDISKSIHFCNGLPSIK